MKSRFLIALFSVFTFSSHLSLHAINRPIHGIVTEGVTVTCDHEGMMLFREKKNRIAMKNLSRSLTSTCEFQVTVANLSDYPLPFAPETIHVVDQTGRALPLVTKDEELAGLRKQHTQRLSDLKKRNSRERDRIASELEEAMAERLLLEKGELPQVEGSREQTLQAIRDILKKERELRYQLDDIPYYYEKKREDLLTRHDSDLRRAKDIYLEETKVQPGAAYRGVFQIRLPRRKLKEMRYITITYLFDGEEYPFTYQVEQRHLRKS